MTPLLTRAQMRAFDAHAIEALAVPGLVLMENAGRGVTDALERELLDGTAAGACVAVVCGTGNNGGDGLVVARLLATRGASVQVVLVGDPSRASTEARVHLEAWRRLGGALRTVASPAEVTQIAEASRGARAIVDALVGTGLDRPLAGLHADAVRALAAAPAPKLAVDLPSGLDADTGAVLGACARAEVTVTLGHAKRGLFTPRGAALAGRVAVADIGVPPALPPAITGVAQLASRGDLGAWLPPRPSAVHKGSGGHVLVVGGSPGTVGAPQLAARGALRAGAGLVTLGTWAEVARAVEGHVLEVMTASIDPEGAGDAVEALARGKKVVAVGPGLGKTDAARALVERLVAAWAGPLVVDADALSLFAGKPEGLRGAAKVIATPHPAEAARLLGVTADAVEGDRFAAVAELARRAGAVVVLKGAHTLVCGPAGEIVASPVACAAMATAGAGDVLTGVIAALAGILAPLEAARAGVLLHAMAGEVWSAARGGADRGLLASELADAIPATLAAAHAGV